MNTEVTIEPADTGVTLWLSLEINELETREYGPVFCESLGAAAAEAMAWWPSLLYDAAHSQEPIPLIELRARAIQVKAAVQRYLDV